VLSDCDLLDVLIVIRLATANSTDHYLKFQLANFLAGERRTICQLPSIYNVNCYTYFHFVKMRGKRSKQYRKLMHQYELTFNFREPYQVLVDADLVKDAARFKMDLPKALERTLQGKVKPSKTAISLV
jgi:hypothetical protein